MFRIPLTSDSLARSRFALSPRPEITETLHLRGLSTAVTKSPLVAM
ncbi:hypothetical protein BN11_3820003 [Nostocoides australiense Ben110]|uniref:Uncharacterized protein n=1 Tax=Nostocoides australiense Ben110 TaxID=1193182 RepID=W6JZF1_9MICO|nr:hypothetical protein [Tetrasphaera australiensis]CCH74085.1 hypothetical protein BN11_3820003 [Tetrasphaera australiensis Ben110]